MYDRDPRADWSASLSHYFPTTAGKPADLMELTPAQLEHLLGTHKKTMQAMESK